MLESMVDTGSSTANRATVWTKVISDAILRSARSGFKQYRHLLQGDLADSHVQMHLLRDLFELFPDTRIDIIRVNTDRPIDVNPTTFVESKVTDILVVNWGI
jgi:hypothetical protein